MKNKLTIKQQKFCKWYVKLGNATRAYLKAGYEASSNEIASSNSWKLLRNENIQEKIQELQEKELGKIGINQEYIMSKYKRILEFDGTEFLETKDNSLTVDNLNNIPIEIRKLIKGIEPVKRGIKITFMDKDNALNNITRIFGMFKDNINHSGNIGVQIIDDIPDREEETI